MKRKYQFTKGLLVMALFAILTCVFASCSDKETGMGDPVITGVRVCDPEKADSLFTKSSQGQQVAIIGENLADIQYITINGQKVSFNPTMNTDHSVIISIPSESNGFKLTTFNSDLKDEIVIVTSHGTATYQFKVLAPYPQMKRISALYPRKAGDKLEVYGLNLVDIEKVYFTDKESEELDTTKWEEVPGNHIEAQFETIKKERTLNTNTQIYETNSQVEVTVPEGAPEIGSLVFECAAGTVYLPYYRVPGKPVVTECSNDMPQVGETLYLVGREFVQVEKIEYCGIELSSEDFTVSESQDTIYIPFKKKPAVESNHKLTITTPGGTVDVNNFYDYSTLWTTFDGDATDNGWGPNSEYLFGDADNGNYAKMDNTKGGNGWGIMIFFRKDWNGGVFNFSSNIPATAKPSELYLAMNVYDDSYFNTESFNGYLRYELLDNNNGVMGMYDDATAPVLQDLNGETHKKTWYRALIPFSKISNFADMSFADMAATGVPQFRIMLMNPQEVKGNGYTKFDNIRVIYIPTQKKK